MFISIIIPLYNKEKTISRAIHSVLNQTHPHFELIIVNDGSTDSGFDTARKFYDPRIMLIDQPNKGVSAARNEGVRRAKFEWISFLDADDEYLPTFLEKVLNFIAKNNNRIISFISSNILYGNTGHSAISNVQTGVYNYFQLCKYDQTPATCSSTAVRREAFIKAGGFQEGLTQFEDWNLWCKLAWIGEFGFIGEPLSCYHIAKTGTASTSERNVKEYYADLMVLPTTIRKWMLDGKIHNDLMRDSCKYMNLYIIGQGWELRRKKERWLMLCFLSGVNLKYLDSVLILMVLKSFILLCLPLGMRNTANKLLMKE